MPTNIPTTGADSYLDGLYGDTKRLLTQATSVLSNQYDYNDLTLIGLSNDCMNYLSRFTTNVKGVGKWLPQQISSIPAITTAATSSVITLSNAHYYVIGNKVYVKGTGTTYDVLVGALPITAVTTNTVTVTVPSGTYPAYTWSSSNATGACLVLSSES